ncbi:MAG TPA: HAMP domain-containing protein, partial [Aquabacterium sp.]|nr:HAMP domain-containing protein [Aquabacterium sp.]
MKTLALRIYLTVVTVLLVFALVSGWLAQRNLEHERNQFQSQRTWAERAAAWGELLENSLPPVTAPRALQAEAFLMWAERLRLPMALDDPLGQRLATSPLLEERLARRPELLAHLKAVQLSDGRVLWVLVRPPGQRERMAEAGHDGRAAPPPPLPLTAPPPWLYPLVGVVPAWMIEGVAGLILSLVLLFVAVAVGAWPVANRLTRRLKALRTGVEVFGSGQLQHRVAVEGKDEVAALAQSFNEAAQRIEDLVTSNRSLLANASHELRSPLARLKMAVAMLGDAPPAMQASLK